MFNSGFQLKIIEGPGFGGVFPLGVPEVSLCRAQEPNHPSTPDAFYFYEGTVSRVHARLLWDDRAKVYKLRHLSKTNQTRVNDKVIQEHILQFGDRISLGKLLLEVQKAPKADHIRTDLLGLLQSQKVDTLTGRQNLPEKPAVLLTELPSDMVGRRVGSYQIVCELGRGSVGRVYEARHTTWNDRFALKILAPEVTHDDTIVQRFLMEAKVASSLRHPNIIQVTDICISDGLVYLVMECLSPRTLQAVLDETSDPLPLKRVVTILEQLLSALDHAHSNGIVHRDVKPGNIIIDEKRDTIALTDFSIARVKDGNLRTTEGVLMGTVEYMAPELFEGHPADPRADMYAVGVILYQLLTGVPPFRGRNMAEVIKSQLLTLPENPRSYNPDVPDWLAEMDFFLLQKNPDHRFSSAREVRSSLLKYSQMT